MGLFALLAVLCGILGPAFGAGPASASAAPPSKASVLPFIHDDFPKAVSEARARGVPIFIDVGAPW